MNTDLLLATAAAIDLEPESFDLGTWGKYDETTICGSAGCVAGQVAAIVNPQQWKAFITNTCLPVYDPQHPKQVAQEALGLTGAEANLLFINPDWWVAAIRKLGLTDHYRVDEDGQPYFKDDGTRPHPFVDCDVLSVVSPKQASEVLRALASGEPTLDLPRCECESCVRGRCECESCVRCRGEEW